MGMACYDCCWFHPFSYWVVTMCSFIVLIFACCCFWKSFVKWVWYLCVLFLSLVCVLMLACGFGFTVFYANISCVMASSKYSFKTTSFSKCCVSLPCVLFWMFWFFSLIFYPCSYLMWYVLWYPFLMFECYLCMLIMIMVNCLIDSSVWSCLYMFLCTITILLHLSYYAP